MYKRQKLDRSLIEALGRDVAAEEVLAAIISLCQALRLPILAEGVETADQAQMLKASGCGYVQGWHFGRPMVAEQIDALAAGEVPGRERPGLPA